MHIHPHHSANDDEQIPDSTIAEIIDADLSKIQGKNSKKKNYTI